MVKLRKYSMGSTVLIDGLGSAPPIGLAMFFLFQNIFVEASKLVFHPFYSFSIKIDSRCLVNHLVLTYICSRFFLSSNNISFDSLNLFHSSVGM